MKTISLIIDNQEVLAQEGDLLLWVALENGFYIPNLCALKERSVSFAGCRLCFVEIEGYPEPITACTETVRAGMVVKTRTAKVQKLQRTAFELILSTHHVDCGHCGKNKKCELQKIALHLKVTLKSKRFRLIPKNLPLDESHPLFTFDPDKCVLCLTCVRSCPYKAMQVSREKGAAESIPEVCQKCGICAGECPAKAIELPVYSDRVILSQMI